MNDTTFPTKKKKIEYTKPEILDLGHMAPVHGGFCTGGSLNLVGDCTGDGNIASGGPCASGDGVTT